MIKVNKNKNFVQMLTFFFGCLVFVTLAGYLVFQIATKKEGPPSLVVHTRYVPGYFGVMVPPVSVKQCHFKRYCNYIKN